MKKGWKIFWLTCGITLVVGIALLGIGLEWAQRWKY